MILFWITIFATTKALSNDIRSADVLIVSLVYVVLSLTNLILTKIQKPYLSKSFKWGHIITIIIFTFYGLSVSSSLVLSNSYTTFYLFASMLILCSSILVLSSIFLYIRWNTNLFIHVFILILFSISLWSFMGYSFIVSEDVPRPLYQSIIISFIAIYIYFCLDYVKYLKYKIIKIFYIGIVFIFLASSTYLGILFLFDMPENDEVSIPLSIVFLIFAIIFAGYSIKRLYYFKIPKKNNSDLEMEQLNYDKEQEIIKNKKPGFFSKYLDGMVSTAFKKDKNGQTIYFPFGNRGRGRIITDTKTEGNIRSLTRGYLKTIIFSSIIIVQFIDFVYIIGLLIISIFVFYYQMQKYIKNCEYSDEKITRKETFIKQTSMYSIGFLWSLLVASALFILMSAVFAVGNSSQEEFLMGLAGTLLFGFCFVVFSYMLKVKYSMIKKDQID